MRRWFPLGTFALLWLTACSAEPPEDTRTVVKINTVQSAEYAEALPEPVQGKLDEILSIADRNSLRLLSAFAMEEPRFRSDVGTAVPYEHWYLSKRAGMDPIDQIELITSHPFEIKDFGDDKYYIWPYLAARSNEELQQDRLLFKERADLRELVGETGLERIAAGESYPGFQLAIRNDGSWAYFVNGR